MQPQNQTPSPTILDPDTLAQVMGQMSGNNQTDPNQSTQNILQLYKQAQQTGSGIPNNSGGQSNNALQNFINQCQKYVELKTYGHAGIFPDAITAAKTYAQNGQLKQGLQGVKPGDLLYFGANPGNLNSGHTGIFVGYDKSGNPIMNSATSNGIMNSNVNAWNQSVAPLLGYVPVK